MPSYSRKVPLAGKSAQELYDKVSGDIDRFLAKASIPGKSEVSRDPAAKTVTVTGSLFSATLVCMEGCLELQAKLSLMAAPFRGKLDEGIDKWLSKAFPS